MAANSIEFSARKQPYPTRDLNSWESRLDGEAKPVRTGSVFRLFGPGLDEPHEPPDLGFSLFVG